MSDTGYVALAYLVFLALILVYFAIMAMKLARVGRDVEAVAELVEGPDRAKVEPDVPVVDKAAR